MIGGITKSIDSAVVFAWVLTRLRLKVAVLVVWALLVSHALRFIDSDTVASGCQTVTVFFWTDTSTAFIDDHASFQSTDTVTILVDLEALVDLANDAFLVDVQSSSRWTHAATEVVDDFVRRTKSCLVTLNCSVAGVTWKAFAHHRSHWQCVQDLANRVDSAWLGGVAGIDAFFADASCLRLAIAVVATEWIVQNASFLVVADKAWRTRAFRLMLVDGAYFVDVTTSCLLARIFTLVVDAGIVQWTLRVASALELDTDVPGITLVAWQAVAVSSVVDSSALSVGSTAVNRARWHALSVDAGMGSRTFVVSATSNLDTSNLRVAIEALFARADGFVFLDAANSVGSAVAGTSADAIDARLLSFAVRVGDASDGSNWWYWLTCATSTADVPFRTHANHRSNWRRWYHLTSGWLVAWRQLGTRIFTSGVDAGKR